MDPLSALGLAAGVVQFVQFAGTLVSLGSSIHRSADGTTEWARELETIYGRLSQFSTRLGTVIGGGSVSSRINSSSINSINNSSINSINNSSISRINSSSSSSDGRAELEPGDANLLALRNLATECHQVCWQLLDAVGKLRVQPGGSHRTLRTFKAVLKTVWERQKIASLEARLDRFQNLISLHFYPVLSSQYQSLFYQVGELQQKSLELSADQGKVLGHVIEQLHGLKASTVTILEKLTHNGIHGVGVWDAPSEADLIRPGQLQRPKDQSTAYRPLHRSSVASGITNDEVERLEEAIASLSLAEADIATIAREQRFLGSLNYDSRRLRHENIPVAHQKTFSWMLVHPTPMSQTVNDGGLMCNDDENDCRGAANFPAWLREGNGIFWVSGKAGAGKSTLIKFVAEHPETRRMLEQWAGSNKLCIAAHYFWSAGTPMQKSQKGLLRSLLFELFRSCPAEIPRICPERWQQTSVDLSGSDWTVNELLTALRTVASVTDLGVRYCVFIDGVDEFEGNHFDFCQLLGELSTSPNLKLCLSSRPWNVFEDAFGGNPDRKLYIHELTRGDIHAYSHSRIAEHPCLNSNGFHELEMTSLVDDIVERAQGVFLWVFLVTRSLLEGMTNGDTIKDLHQRLFSLPVDLEPFFRSMLDAVDPIYGEKMAETLSIASNAHQPLHHLNYWIHEYSYEDEDYVLKSTGPDIPTSNSDALREQCRRRINARCGGLLEVKKTNVEFLHRTVRDFLLTREMSEYLAAKCRGRFFVNLATLAANVALIERGAFRTVASLRIGSLLAECQRYAVDALDESRGTAMALLDLLEDVYPGPEEVTAQDAQNAPQFVWPRPAPERNKMSGHAVNYRGGLGSSMVRMALLSAGVERFVEVKIQEDPAYFDNGMESPLSIIVRASQWSRRHSRIILRLLRAGYNPNGGDRDSASTWTGYSPWTRFLEKVYSIYDSSDSNYDPFLGALENSLFSLFIQKGARMGIYVPLPGSLIRSRGNDMEILSEGYFVWQTPAIHGNKASTPAVGFLHMLFTHVDAYTCAKAAMAALRDFLFWPTVQGADGWSNQGLPPAMPSTEIRDMTKILQTNLDRLRAGSRLPSAMRLKFYAEVTGAVVEVAVQHGDEDLSWLLPSIQGVFSRSLGSPLVGMVMRGREEFKGQEDACRPMAGDVVAVGRRRPTPSDPDVEVSNRCVRDKRMKLDHIMGR